MLADVSKMRQELEMERKKYNIHRKNSQKKVHLPYLSPEKSQKIVSGRYNGLEEIVPNRDMQGS